MDYSAHENNKRLRAMQTGRIVVVLQKTISGVWWLAYFPQGAEVYLCRIEEGLPLAFMLLRRWIRVLRKPMRPSKVSRDE